jgi:hypothetical protein
VPSDFWNDDNIAIQKALKELLTGCYMGISEAYQLIELGDIMAILYVFESHSEDSNFLLGMCGIGTALFGHYCRNGDSSYSPAWFKQILFERVSAPTLLSIAVKMSVDQYPLQGSRLQLTVLYMRIYSFIF